MAICSTGPPASLPMNSRSCLAKPSGVSLTKKRVVAAGAAPAGIPRSSQRGGGGNGGSACRGQSALRLSPTNRRSFFQQAGTWVQPRIRCQCRNPARGSGIPQSSAGSLCRRSHNRFQPAVQTGGSAGKNLNPRHQIFQLGGIRTAADGGRCADHADAFVLVAAAAARAAAPITPV